jgi:hypothetical protein
LSLADEEEGSWWKPWLVVLSERALGIPSWNTAECEEVNVKAYKTLETFTKLR